MNKHTPGPWEFERDDWSETYFVGPARISLFDKHGKSEANAKLIWAAPDLLEALKEVVRVCKANECAIVDRIYDQCKAAIAKATGESE